MTLPALVPWGSGWRHRRLRIAFPAVCAAGIAMADAEAQETVSNLLARYETIGSVRCDVRREVDAGAGRGRKLSRVTFERGGRLHVENLAPLRRRIVSDGTNFFSYAEGDPLGFSRSVAELDETMRIGLFAVPGTPMEHLLRLKGRPETPLPAGPGEARRVVIRGEPLAAVLGLDAQDRVVRVELHSGEPAESPEAVWTYENFIAAGAGAWIASVHRTEVRGRSGEPVRETARFDNLRIDASIDPAAFDPGRHFTGVVFTNTFEAIY